MFLYNKYTKWYFSIIGKAILRKDATGYTEVHHIIPKSMGGNNTKDNLVVLTAKEHFVCHLLLVKAVDNEYKKKMNFAFWRMCNVSENRHKPTAKQYSIGKTLFIESHTGHAPYLLSHSDSTKIKISNTVSGKLSNLSDADRLSRVLNSCCRPDTYTVERNKNISIALKGKAKSEKHKKSMMSTYIFTSPDGTEFLHVGMAEACKIHGLNYGSVKNSLTKNKIYKGWKITHGK